MFGVDERLRVQMSNKTGIHVDMVRDGIFLLLYIYTGQKCGCIVLYRRGCFSDVSGF